MWYQRLQSNQRVVDDWHKILLVRSLVLKPQDDVRPWLDFAAMCRKANRYSLVRKTLVSLVGHDPEAVPEKPLPIMYPNASYEYAKYLYSLPDQQHRAYTKLQTFVTHLNQAAVNLHNEASVRILISKVYLKLGEWHEDIHGVNEETLPTITKYNHHARVANESCYKAWHAYAFSNFQALLMQQTKLEQLQVKSTAAAAVAATNAARGAGVGETSPGGDSAENDDNELARICQEINRLQKRLCEYACEAVKGFIRSIAVGESSTSVQDCLRLLTIWFQHGHNPSVEQVLKEGLKTLHVDTWLQMIPQLIARIDTPRPAVSQLVHQVITDFGKQHPQALLYPLTVAAKSSDKCRSNAAEKLLNKMREHSSVLVNQAALVSEELIRVAILRHERWHEALEEASRLYFGERNDQAMLRTLLPLHSMMDKEPETLNEVAFNQAYSRDLAEAKDWCLRFQRSSNVRDLNQAWELYYNVFKRICRQIPTLTSLELHSVSPRLLTCRDLDIAVPGSYAPNAPLICISYVHPSLQVFSTKQRPRKLCIRASTGHDIMFLLKGHEDLRQDERVMQLFGLVNTFLVNNPETFRRNLTVQRYAVVPLSTNSGLIGWLPHCDTLHVLIKDWRDKKKILITIEHRIMMKMAPSLEHLTAMQKVEVFEHALELTQGDDLAKLLWLKSPSSEVWFDRRTNYTRSLAAMSMIGYVLGLGDRHPSNLMLDQKSGKIIHIDFGDCFEVAMTREKYPEKIPFRLTRMLVNAMGVTGIDGTYRMTCESVMSLLRRNKDSVMAMLEAFVYDPLLNWRLIDQQQQQAPPRRPADGAAVVGPMVAPSAGGVDGAPEGGDGATGSGAAIPGSVGVANQLNGKPEALNKKAVAIVNRVRDKLTGRDFLNQEEPLDVAKQVDLLIAQATNHENLSQCFIGWCPFW
ncbi:hypothetical protein HAZT_HAZT004190 [Hyalella azteca]|nr:hypothetical protein HAZT_HAZT004190 [Hyalella azteca]